MRSRVMPALLIHVDGAGGGFAFGDHALAVFQEETSPATPDEPGEAGSFLFLLSHSFVLNWGGKAATIL